MYNKESPKKINTGSGTEVTLRTTIDPQWENRFTDKQMAVIAKSLLDLATQSTVRSEMPDLDQYVKDFMSALYMGN